MPFHAAKSTATPMKRPIKAKALHPRLAELRVMTMAYKMAATTVLIPRTRAINCRGGLLLQMVQRMKLGCAWCRRVHSTVAATSWNALGWVVTDKAFTTAVLSLQDKLSILEPPSAM